MTVSSEIRSLTNAQPESQGTVTSNEIPTAAPTIDTAEPDTINRTSLAGNAARLDISAGAMAQDHLMQTTGAQDKTALLQTAQSALDEIYAMLQQGKKLAIQASKLQDSDEKQALQNKINQISQDIHRVSTSTQYNKINLFTNGDSLTPNDQTIINSLKSDWLEEAENVIAERYGLAGDGANLTIALDETPEPFLAATEFNYDSSGKAVDESLHIAVQTSLPAALPNGGEAPFYDDRVMTHEMVHAIMGRTMNFKALPNWFKEGTAEFIHGADERVAGDLAHSGGGMDGATAIQNALGDGTDKAWVNDSLHYSSAFMAVRYLHNQIKAAGHSGGIKDLLTDLKDNPTENLDQALNHVSNYIDTSAFISDYVSKSNGAAFIHNLDTAGEFTTALNGGDTGGIGGADADNGPVQTATSVIPDTNDPANQPLKHFHVIWPESGQKATSPIQVGASQGMAINYTPLKIDSTVLGTDKVDLVNNPDNAVTTFTNALTYVAGEQAQLNQLKNKLAAGSGQSGNSDAAAGIQDAATAQKMAAYVKANLSENAVSAYSQQQPARVFHLLAATNYFYKFP
ncbi:Hypothetical protein LUCI_4401 [Lucifera butyrica]|uniref:Flagellin N-terminal domain-containing protein n=1 Tax=Lucifera butyrica TaxID=1351585 RepID=A0A498RDQ7_9FIRM|nr:flagellinolysin [Lucifera butyrica]VBB09115.1 Hypothetical protein LUCI_4401 [Lucifera butyrica]